jgi:hypothetical protein
MQLHYDPGYERSRAKCKDTTRRRIACPGLTEVDVDTIAKRVMQAAEEVAEEEEEEVAEEAEEVVAGSAKGL